MVAGGVPRMSDDRDRVLRVAAVGFACAAAYNSIVAIREDLPGEPFGLRIPLPVSTGILVGWGAAVAAPWPMPVAALAASRARKAGAALVCAGLGIAGIVGILIEPNTYRSESWTPPTRRAVFLHVTTSMALAGAGISHLRRAK
jgi:hypothetical protein